MTHAPAPAPGAWRWEATGTVWHLHHDGCVDASVAGSVARLVETDERRWSRFLPTSDVGRLNRAAGREVVVSAETVELLQAAAAWRTVTSGLFDPLVGGALRRWGYAASIRIAAPGVEASPAPEPVRGTIEIDPERGRVRLPRGTELDLGGIAKGWMADRAARLLRASVPHGRVLVDAGGDLVAARGRHEVAVEGLPGVALALEEGDAVATSGWTVRRWRNGDGPEAHHLIDPRTGSPGPRTSATVVASTAAAADVLAKTLALAPALVDLYRLPAFVSGNGVARGNAAWPAAVAEAGRAAATRP